MKSSQSFPIVQRHFLSISWVSFALTSSKHKTAALCIATKNKFIAEKWPQKYFMLMFLDCFSWLWFIKHNVLCMVLLWIGEILFVGHKFVFMFHFLFLFMCFYIYSLSLFCKSMNPLGWCYKGKCAEDGQDSSCKTVYILTYFPKHWREKTSVLSLCFSGPLGISRATGSDTAFFKRIFGTHALIGQK